MCKFLRYTHGSRWLMNYRHGTLFIVSVVLTTYKKDKLCQPLWSLSCISINGKKTYFVSCGRIPSAQKCYKLHHQKYETERKKKELFQTGSFRLMKKKLFLPPSSEIDHTQKRKNVVQVSLCQMQKAAAINLWRGAPSEVGVWLGRLTWEFWIWMVPGGSAWVNTCPCDVTMATGWYRVPPEGIICRLWVSSGVSSYPPPSLLPPPPFLLPPWLEHY